MSRYFEPITIAEFEEKLKCLSKKHFGDKEFEARETQWNSNWSYLNFTYWKSITPKIVKDLAKIQFSDENMEVDNSGESGWPPLGIQQLDNGFVYLAVMAGGDWEMPVYFIIYWDGKEMRGYVPESGNCYNHKAKSAWGNEDDLDIEECAKMGMDADNEYPLDYILDVFKWDTSLLLDDIQKRIVQKEK